MFKSHTVNAIYHLLYIDVYNMFFKQYFSSLNIYIRYCIIDIIDIVYEF
jgi:hypothetical protein